MADLVTLATAVGWGITISHEANHLQARQQRFDYLDVAGSSAKNLQNLEKKVLQLKLMLESAQAVPSGAVKTKLEGWAKELKSAFYDAEDILDVIDYHRLKCKALLRRQSANTTKQLGLEDGQKTQLPLLRWRRAKRSTSNTTPQAYEVRVPAPDWLRWRRKLQRAADECDAALHRWKLRELQEEDARERLERAPLPRRVVHAVLCFVSGLFLLVLARGGDDERSRACAAVQRFERLASGAAEFLRCVEFGSAPRRWCGGGGLFGFGPVVGKLGGEHASYERLQGAPQQQYRFLDAGPASPAELWVDSKPCHAYPKRRASGKKLLLV